MNTFLKVSTTSEVLRSEKQSVRKLVYDVCSNGFLAFGVASDKGMNHR